MSAQTLEFTESEIVHKKAHRAIRYPKLNTVFMVEDFLKAHRDLPLKIVEIHRQLPRQIMHSTLKVILEYLWKSGKIIYGPKGIQWIYSEPEHLRKMLENTVKKAYFNVSKI